jgi:hypothetical protein
VRFALVVMLAACGRIGFDPDAGEPSGLILHFAFESDGLLHDRGPGHYDATCNACPTATTGRVGRGAAFSGSECMVITAPLQPAAFTFAVWMLPSAAQYSTSFTRTFHSATASTNTMEVYLNAQDHWFAGVNTMYASKLLDHGAWHHVAGVYDGNQVIMYVDGTRGGAITVGAAQYSDDNYYIGCDVNIGVTKDYFIGTIDDVRLYDHALSALDVAQLVAL